MLRAARGGRWGMEELLVIAGSAQNCEYRAGWCGWSSAGGGWVGV